MDIFLRKLIHSCKSIMLHIMYMNVKVKLIGLVYKIDPTILVVNS